MSSWLPELTAKLRFVTAGLCREEPVIRKADYIRTIRKEFARKPVRNLLAAATVLLSSCVLVTLVAFTYAARQVLLSQLGPNQSLNLITVTAAKAAAFGGLYSNIQLANQNNNLLTDATVKQVSAIPQVLFVSLVSQIYEFKNFQVAGTEKTFIAQTEGLTNPNAATLPLSAGHEFNPASDNHDVVLGLAYARQLGYGSHPAALIGKSVQITTQNGYRGAGAALPGPLATQIQNDQFNAASTTLQATIVGVTTNGPSQSRLFLSEAWAREIRTSSYWQFDASKAAGIVNPVNAPFAQVGDLKSTDQIAQDGYTSLVVAANGTAAVPGIASAIDHMGLGEISSAQLVKQLNGYSRTLWLIIGTVALVTFIASAMSIVNALLALVNEQRSVIAVWRACGATRLQIIKQYLLHAAVIGLFGGVTGAIAGLVVSDVGISRVNQLLAVNAIGVMPLNLTGYILLPAVIVFTVLFSVVVGIYPAASAANEDLCKVLAAGQ